MSYTVTHVDKATTEHPMTVLRQGQLITDYPQQGDLAMYEGELWVLLTVYQSHPGAPQHLGWYPVAAPSEVIQYLFG